MLTSITLEEAEVKRMMKEAMVNCFKEFLGAFKDVRNHFVNKEKKSDDELITSITNSVLSRIELVFENAVLPSGKSDKLTKDQVQAIKESVTTMLKDIPSVALNQMVKSWHCFRLECSGYWTSLGDKFVVDSSILSDTIHPVTNTQGGRVTKNLDKLELYVADVTLYLDGGSTDNKNFEIELVMNYELEVTIRLGKALLIDSTCESKRIIRNLEDTMFYKLPELDKCILSEQHK